MIKKTLAEIIEFALDPKATSLNAKVDDRYMSFMKLPVGAATYVYGTYRFDPTFIERKDNQYTLAAIVASGIVYVVNEFNFFGWIQNDYDEFPNTRTFAGYYLAVNEKAQALYTDWYAKLPLRDCTGEKDGEMSDSGIDCARADFITHGRDSNTFAEPPATQQFVQEMTAIQTLTGTLELEPYLLQQFEAERDEYIDLKTLRTRLLEIVRRGGDLPEETQTIADAIRDVDAQMFTLTLEHDGLVRECKYYKIGLQRSLCSSRIETGYLTFKTRKESDELSEAFFGRWNDNIPLSYISKITFKGKALYVRKDED